MAFIITTTGTAPDIGFGAGGVVFKDLGSQNFAHPLVSYDLEQDFTRQEIAESVDVQNAIDQGWITVVDENGVSVTDASSGVNTDERVKVTSNDTTPDYLLSKLSAGTNITITETNDGGDELVTIAATGGAADELVKVSANDTTSGYLNGKLTAGANITLTENNDGANETFTIASTAAGADELVKVSANDTTADYLFNKLAAGTGISITETNDAGDEDVTIAFDGTAAETTYSNTTSGLTATDVQAAIDEVEGRVDSLETDQHVAVTLDTDLDTTQQAANLVGQELELLKATSSTDGVMSSEDKTKADFITVTQAVDLDTMESDISTLQTDVTALQTSYNRRRKVIDIIVDNTLAPPTEVSGDRYILSHDGGTPNAAWDGAAANDIVEFDGSVWVATTPVEGWVAYVDNQNKDALQVDDGTPQWELRLVAVNDAVSISYDNSTASYPGAPSNVQEALDAADSRLDSLETDQHVALTLDTDLDTTEQAANLVGQELELLKATTSTDGVMSSEDKTKLDGITAGAEPDQNLWETVTADTGSTTANTITDTLTIAGGTDISTSITGDTLTINSTFTPKLSWSWVAARNTTNINSGTYLRGPDAIATSQTPFVCPVACTLTNLSAYIEGSGTATYTIEIIKNGVTGAPVETIVVTDPANKATKTSTVTFAAGDEISIRITHATSGGDRPDYPMVTLIFREN
jgi:hypothetical protein